MHYLVIELPFYFVQMECLSFPKRILKKRYRYDPESGMWLRVSFDTVLPSKVRDFNQYYATLDLDTWKQGAKVCKCGKPVCHVNDEITRLANAFTES